MIITQVLSDNGDDNGGNNSGVLDLSVKKRLNDGVHIKSNQKLPSSSQLSVLLSPPSSTTSSSSSSSSSSSMISPKRSIPSTKRMLDLSSISTTYPITTSQPTGPSSASKRPLRFQCKHCDYKAPSTSLMQNHIYRHTDLTPYACAYCGHKSTTKSTIMVHIELCHPNMEVKIIENRVREQDFYRDLNSSEISNASLSMTPTTIVSPSPPAKKQRRSNSHSQRQYDSESAPINGVAITLKPIVDDGPESSSPASISDDTSEMENLEPTLLQTAHHLFDEDDHSTFFHPPSPMGKTLKVNFSPHQQIPIPDPTTTSKETDSDDGCEYLLVYNRPKQYYGSLYEPDKQYACKLCSYTTNHRPSMEDHVFVHTNEKPYKCGYCGEEIYTRYAATYHIKYKHAGMERNFIQNKADVTQYYVNRAKKEDEKNQFKVIDTRRVKVPTRNGKSVINQQHKIEYVSESAVQLVLSPPPPTVAPPQPPPPPPPPPPPQPTQASKASTSALSTPVSSNNLPAGLDYRLLFAWSYYMASQAAWLSPLIQQQQQQQRDLSSPVLPTDPEAAAKFFQQAMQAAMGPLASTPAGPASDDHDEIDNKSESGLNTGLFVIKEEASES